MNSSVLCIQQSHQVKQQKEQLIESEIEEKEALDIIDVEYENNDTE